MTQLTIALYLLVGVFWAREADDYSQQQRRKAINWKIFLFIVAAWLPLLILAATLFFYNRGK